MYPSGRHILDLFPYETPRAGQAELLTTLQRIWNQFDVFIIVAPTAFGKTALMRTIQSWKYSVSAITPTNMLVDQFLKEFPDAPTLHRLDSYHCDEWQSNCAAVRGRKRAFCSGCCASRDLATARYRRGPGIYNYYTYLAHRLFRDILIVDEAHNLVPTIQERLAERIWLHDYPALGSPSAPTNAELLRRWDRLASRQKKHAKIQHLHEALTSLVPHHVIQFTTDPFNGKGTKRGEPEERPCIKLFPVDIGEAFGMFTGPETQKIILMSATIGPVDVTELGLQRKRVCYLQAAHPIDPSRRPVQIVPVADLSYRNLEENVPALAAEIENIAQYHTGEKGVIHCTYQLSTMLSEYLTDSRYMFHSRENKREQYEKFRESPLMEGKVLVACGMYEGIDLPDDLGRWQVIAKVPWKSLANPAIRHKAERDPDWYNWSTQKDLIQAAGRISRHESDYGVSYVLDGSADRLLREGAHLTPSWFSDALT